MDPKIVANETFLRMRKDELTDAGELLKKFTASIHHNGELLDATAYVDSGSVKPCYIRARDENNNAIMERDGYTPKLTTDRDHAIVRLGHPDNPIQLTVSDGYDEKGQVKTKIISMFNDQFTEEIAEAGLIKAVAKNHPESKREIPDVETSGVENDGAQFE